MRTSTEITAAIEAINPDVRLSYNRHISAIQRRRFLVEVTESELNFCRGAEDLTTPGNTAPRLFAFVKSDTAAELAALDATIRVLENSAHYAEAVDSVKPLLAELEAALETEQADRHATAILEQDRREKAEAAKAKALADIEKKFAAA